MKSNEFGTLKRVIRRQIFYVDARISSEILANEWDKRIYLTALEEARTLFKVEVYAFCILNDRLRILAGGRDVRERTVRRMLTAAFERYDRETDLIGEKDAIPSDCVMRTKVVKIEKEEDAVTVIRFIHLTPFSEGYALYALDYWWTSYSTYRGHYNWTLVDTAPVMKYLSRHDTRAEWTLAEFHRRGETLHNPMPECIKKSSYEVIPIGTAAIMQGNINERFMVHA